jgi:signal transduction histidine kinase
MVEHIHLDKNGNKRNIEINAFPIFDDEGNLYEIIEYSIDITERKKAEAELRKHREQLEDLVKERTNELEATQEELVMHEKLSVLGRMTAVVSHELRNPLGVIRGSTFLLRNMISKDEEKGRKHLNRINEQLQICDSIVEELLEYTRGSRSEMVEDSMNPWVEEILGQINVPDQMRLDLDLYPGLNNIRFDKEKMRRVIINLVQNAIQAVRARQEIEKEKNEPYQPSIRLSTSMWHDSICLMVDDNGLGMNKETVQQAFEPLFTTRARGTGLGLAIVKKIVEEHGGTVSIESEPGRGTKAIVMIPGSNQIGD